MDLAHHDLETKAGFAPDNPLQDAHVTHAEMMRTFDAFKAANDERIASIERRSADVLHDDKVARIDAALDAQTRRLDELTLKSARPASGPRDRHAHARRRASTRPRSRPMSDAAKARACARSK